VLATVATAVLTAAPAMAESNSCTVQPRRGYCSAGDTSVVFEQRYTTDMWHRLSYVYARYEAEILCDSHCPGTVLRISS
jgi:hypothetical protein